MKPITERTFLEFQYVSGPMFSPDGSLIAFLSEQADYDNNCYKGDIHLIEGETTRRLTGLGDVHGFCWTPDGKLLFPAFRTKEEKAAASRGYLITPYYEIDPKGGEAVLAFTLPLQAGRPYFLSGDLYYFVAEYDASGVQDGEERLAREKKERVYHTFDEHPFMKSDPGYQNGKRSRVYLYDRKSGVLTPVSGPDEHVTDVSDDHRDILYAAAGYTSTVRDQDVSLFTFSPETGKVKKVMDKSRLTERNCEVYGRLWGDKVAVFGTEGKTYGCTESPAVWLIDRETGDMTLFSHLKYNINYRNITSDHKLCGGDMKVVSDRIYFTVTAGYQTYVQYFDKAGNWSGYLTPDGSVDSFDVFGERLVHCGFHGNTMPEIYEGKRQLSHQNDKLFSELSVSVPEHFSFINSDGYEIDGWIMKPVSYEPGRKYPAILHLHGGPRCLFGDIFFHEHQMWANDGYFFFFCNPRGSEGKGDDFADIWGKLGTIDFRDLMEFTDQALARCPDADPKRVGVLGGSYGGFMTNWVISHTGRFAAACAQRSISNWISYEYATSNGYYWVPNFLRCRTREDVESVWEMSPLKNAHTCTTPTLFIHSDGDNVCWMAEGIQMYTALKMAGVPCRMCLFHGEGHELSRSGRPQPRLARMEEIHKWMNKYLK